jgi:uncharacterized protein with ParB-like and HNH nuclease domain
MEANPTLIINYFSGFKQNLVPLFQRPYTWGEKQWRTLWEDLLDFYGYAEGESRATHFMGAVVTMPARSVPVGVSKFSVIDGQQRLTTIALLLCAIRDALPGEDEVQKSKIQSFYLTNYGNPGLDFFKFLPTQGDREAYSPIVQNLATPFPDSQFKKAYDFFRRRLRDQVDDGVTVDASKILHLVENRLMVVMINLSDNDDPYLIFESLNFKGSPLEQADLVRNYFLMRFAVTEQQAVYDQIWLPMQERLGPNLTEFMRHFLGAEGEDVRKGDVYASIKRLVTDAENASVRLLMSRMEKLSVLYSRIATVAPEPIIRLKSYFEYFRRLDFGTVYPLLLALYEDYEDGQFVEDEFLSVLRILFSFTIRRMVVGVPSNSLAGMFVGLCKSKPVTETPSAWLSSILSLEQRNRRWPSDLEFSEYWVNSDMYHSRRACPVILETIESHFDHHEPVQLDQTTIEHVMPQVLSPEWQVMLGNDGLTTHARWLHTIGNLTLTGYNPELGNKSYVEKRSIYGLSHFELNRYFANFESWGQPMIADRATALFKVALQLWPRPADAVVDALEAAKVTSAAFHPECVRRVEQHLKIQLSKVSQTKYESDASHVRIVCAVSAEHGETSGIPYYWFAFHQSQLEFLSASEKQFICLGCGSAASILLMPLKVLQPNLASLSMTEGENRHYWHIVIQKKEDKLLLKLLGGSYGPDLTEYNISSGPVVN